MTKSEQLLISLKPNQKIVVKNQSGRVTIYAYGGDEDVPYEKRDYVAVAFGRMCFLTHAGAVEVIKHHGVRNWSIEEYPA